LVIGSRSFRRARRVPPNECFCFAHDRKGDLERASIFARHHCDEGLFSIRAGNDPSGRAAHMTAVILPLTLVAIPDLRLLRGRAEDAKTSALLAIAAHGSLQYGQRKK